MAKKLYEETNIQSIAAAIRNKLGTEATYLVSQMAAAINSIVTPILQNKTVTENGTVTPDSGYNGLNRVIVNVPVQATLVHKSITANGTWYASSDDADGYDVVIASVVPNLQSKTVTYNQTVRPDTGYDGLSQVVVNVEGGGGGRCPRSEQDVLYQFVTVLDGISWASDVEASLSS